MKQLVSIFKDINNLNLGKKESYIFTGIYLTPGSASFPGAQTHYTLALMQWQHWWWFWFTGALSFYYALYTKLTQNRLPFFNPRIVTSYRSHGRWGDLIICAIPVFWCINILSSSHFLLRALEWQTETSPLVLRVRGKQWYWIYKIELNNHNAIEEIPRLVGHDKKVSFKKYTTGTYKRRLDTITASEYKKNKQDALLNNSKVYNNRFAHYYRQQKAIHRIDNTPNQNYPQANRYNTVLKKEFKYIQTKNNSNGSGTSDKQNQTEGAGEPNNLYTNRRFDHEDLKNFLKTVNSHYHGWNPEEHELNHRDRYRFIKLMERTGLEFIKINRIDLKKIKFLRDHMENELMSKQGLLKKIIYITFAQILSKPVVREFRDKRYTPGFITMNKRGSWHKLMIMNRQMDIKYLPRDLFKNLNICQTLALRRLMEPLYEGLPLIYHNGIFGKMYKYHTGRFIGGIKVKNPTATVLANIIRLVTHKEPDMYIPYLFYVLDPSHRSTIPILIKHAKYRIKINNCIELLHSATKTKLQLPLLSEKEFKTALLRGQSLQKLLKTAYLRPAKWINASAITNREGKVVFYRLFPFIVWLDKIHWDNMLKDITPQHMKLRLLNKSIKKNLIVPRRDASIIPIRQFRYDFAYQLRRDKKGRSVPIFFKHYNKSSASIQVSRELWIYELGYVLMALDARYTYNIYDDRLLYLRIWDSLLKIEQLINKNKDDSTGPTTNNWWPSQTKLNTALVHNYNKNLGTVQQNRSSNRWVRNNNLNIKSLKLIKTAGTGNKVIDIRKVKNVLSGIRNPEQNMYITLKQKKIEKTNFTSRLTKKNYSYGEVGELGLWKTTNNTVNPTPGYKETYQMDYKAKVMDRALCENKATLNKSYPYQKRLLWVNKQIVLPTHVAITIITNSYDVIHSWFVPGLGLKLDCVPGRSTHHTIYIEHQGYYYGQCAEVCGRRHHHMPIKVFGIPIPHFIFWWNKKLKPTKMHKTM